MADIDYDKYFASLTDLDFFNGELNEKNVRAQVSQIELEVINTAPYYWNEARILEVAQEKTDRLFETITHHSKFNSLPESLLEEVKNALWRVEYRAKEMELVRKKYAKEAMVNRVVFLVVDSDDEEMD